MKICASCPSCGWTLTTNDVHAARLAADAHNARCSVQRGVKTRERVYWQMEEYDPDDEHEKEVIKGYRRVKKAIRPAKNVVPEWVREVVGE